jgi:hypothetical protein
MSVSSFTLLHVIISLIGIVAGGFVVAGMIDGKRVAVLTAIFLAATVLTSATGFLFHVASFGPPQAVGIISLIVLAVTLHALYGRHLAGRWRWAYIVGAVAALYLNVFVSVVQAFQKIAVLQIMAPTQSEPPFVATEVAVLAAFVGLGYPAVRRYRPTIAALA